MNDKARWAIVILFAAAMAWMESATVVYLRLLVERIDPYQANPLPKSVGLGATELVREVATLLMLFAAGWLAGRNGRTRLGYFVIAFGVWDILYYIFLTMISGWPNSLFDWDILFLLPLPWWGPVIAPVSIASLMIIGGTLVTQFEDVWPSRATWLVNVAGVALALFVFMADAIRALGSGVEAVRGTLPVQFLWPLFLVALILMAAPIGDVLRQLWNRRASITVTSSGTG